jgi:hypothetical protein
MAKFIEVTDVSDTKRLINTAWIEEIWDSGHTKTIEGATIYFAFNCPNGVDQDSLCVKESYEDIKRMVLEDGK